MHIETLKLYCDLIETKSFSKAARLNSLSQSAVSQQIKQVEERFKSRLVERTSRTLRPTEAGLVFYHRAKDILDRYYELEGELIAQTATVRGSVKIGTTYTIGLYLMPPHIRRFLQRHPQVNVHVRYERADRIHDELTAHMLDLGIVAFPVRRQGFETIPFTFDRLVAVTAPTHPLAQRERITPEELAEQSFVSFDRDMATRRAVDRLLRHAKVQVKTVAEFDNIETIKSAVELNMGVALLPHPAVAREQEEGRLAVLELDAPEEWIRRPLGIVYRKGKSFTTAVRRFTEVLTSSQGSDSRDSTEGTEESGD